MSVVRISGSDPYQNVTDPQDCVVPPPLNVLVREAGEADAPVPLELNPEDEVVEVRQVPRGQLIHRLQRD